MTIIAGSDSAVDIPLAEIEKFLALLGYSMADDLIREVRIGIYSVDVKVLARDDNGHVYPADDGRSVAEHTISHRITGISGRRVAHPAKEHSA